jgi:hypothetical protein
MPIQIQLRRGTLAEWTASNPILAVGEVVLETDSNRFKVGDGVLQYISLPYGGIQGTNGEAIDPFFLYGRG